MMKRFCQTQRFAHIKQFEKLITRAKNKGTTSILEPAIYDVLLNHLQKKDPHLRDYRHFPHPDGALILPSSATQFNSTTTRNGSSVGIKKPNNGIWWKDGGTTHHGFVIHVLQVPVGGFEHQLVVEPTRTITLENEAEIEAEWVNLLGRMMVRVGQVMHGSYVLVPASAVEGLCVYRETPAWVVGNTSPLVLWHALNVDVPVMDHMAGWMPGKQKDAS